MRPQIEVLTSIITERHSTIKLNAEMIIDMVRRCHKKALPDNAEVAFNVPSGGDYSGMKIEVDNDNCVWVSWKTQHVKDTRDE